MLIVVCLYCVYKTNRFYSLRRQVIAINKLSEGGMYFWDYGNAFLLQASRAGIYIFFLCWSLYLYSQEICNYF